jgi:hypothetical protein
MLSPGPARSGAGYLSPPVAKHRPEQVEKLSRDAQGLRTNDASAMLGASVGVVHSRGRQG